ncbi:MAG: PEP-CTERM sorting domain-containing protein [Symploca sp. SIO2G7]|nr:PEP-CTERM sorting domain-containing protein [Symploca sp. SIO2G7]
MVHLINSNFFKVSALTLVTLVSTTQVAKGISFQGMATSTFGTPTPSTGVVFSGVGTNTFSNGTPVTGSSANIFTVDGLNFSTTENTQFAVADLTYTNGQTVTGTNIDTVPVTLSLDFITPSISSQSFTFTFDLDLTPNTTGDPVLDADTLSVVDVFSTTNFNVGGDLFTLKLLGFSNDSGATINNVFTLPEDATTTSQLFASITAATPQGVPEPSLTALLLLGAGAMVRGKGKK